MAASPAEPLSELLALHRDGELPGRYPRAQQLVRELSPAELVQAGRILARLDPGQIQHDHPQVPAVTVAVTGHATLPDLVPALTAELARAGLLLRPVVSDFDGYVFDLSDPGSPLYAADPDLVLCVLDPGVVIDELPTPWGPSDAERVLTEKIALLNGLAATFSATSRGTLVLNTLPLPSSLTAQLTDHRSRARLSRAWYEASARLLALAEEHPSVIVVDLAPLAGEGLPVQEPRQRAYAKAGLSPELLARYAREAGHFARHLTGRTKKCLVLDLDGTLWGGVLGDDGADGIEIGEGLRGGAFRDFQRVVKQLGAQGVLIAAISKNDAEPVLEVLSGHPGMVLREPDFVRVTANWRPKHDNLRELAEGLNLGLESFVFADDSAYECGLVARELPEVAVIRLDDEPALHGARLLADGWFDVRGLTDDDRARPASYRAELERKDFLDTFDSLNDYLRELQVTVRLSRAERRDVPRLSQLSLRTNQFNLTTLRLQPADVRALLDDPAAWVLTIGSADRFGDDGLVGAVFARREGDNLHIGNFLLSCRVFSRGIEQACLAALLRHAQAEGVRQVTGEHRLTRKNGKVRDFYERNGFTRVGVEDEVTRFRHDLRELSGPPAHIDLTERLEGSSL
jgi:FkbH-like protein